MSDLELRRPGPSYTVDTLEELSTKAPDNELFLIVGGDIAAGLPRWREPERVLSLATLAVAERRGTSRGAIDRGARAGRGRRRAGDVLPDAADRHLLDDVRERVAGGKPIKYLVPDPVAQYIAERTPVRGMTP